MRYFYLIMGLFAVASLYTNLFWENGLVQSTIDVGGFNVVYNLFLENGAFRSSMTHLLYSMIAGGYFVYRFVRFAA